MVRLALAYTYTLTSSLTSLLFLLVRSLRSTLPPRDKRRAIRPLRLLYVLLPNFFPHPHWCLLTFRVLQAEGKPHDHTSGDNHTSTASGSSTSATASTAAGSSDGDPVVMPFTSKGLFFAGLLGGLGAVFLGL